MTEARIATLPENERIPWQDYLAKSARLLTNSITTQTSQEGPSGPGAPASAKISEGLRLDAPAAWYATEEARTVAGRIIEWQTVAGGWTKGVDYRVPRGSAHGGKDVWSVGTFDNGATVDELRFLARVITDSGPGDVPLREQWMACFVRGMRYVFDAQYPNGGYPQIYPLAGGYHDAVTYNDNAMAGVLELLADIAEARAGYDFVPTEVKDEAARRLALGVSCVLKSQIIEPSGRRTAWCQQHDALTLQPCAARNFEPVAVATAESAALVRLLMRRAPPGPELLATLDAAVGWMSAVALRDKAWDRSGPVTKLKDAAGAPLIWARLYELETDRPLFGDRDRSLHYDIGELSPERQHGYGWFGNWPARVLKEYPKWRARGPR